MYTPDSVRRKAPLRHLSQAAGRPYSLAPHGWPGVARRACCAAARFSRLRSRTHSPCSQLHARLAGRIAAPAGRLLPYPFTPHLLTQAGLLSVAVVVAPPLPAAHPHLLFREATSPARLPQPAGSREVPLPIVHRQRRLHPLSALIQLLTCQITLSAGSRTAQDATCPIRSKKCIIAPSHCQIRGVFRPDRNHKRRPRPL